jgi:deazaflavin-dependent oxidoreductase (nitroreductase family)
MPLPGSLARFNRIVTNRITRPFAARLPGFGVVNHIGRRTGRRYFTPVSLFRRPGGFTIALTYGRGDWVQNVLHAGSVEVTTRGRTHWLTHPTVVKDPDHTEFPPPVRTILRLIHADEELRADEVVAGG